MNIEILLDSIVIAFLGLSLLVCIILLISIFIYLRPFSSTVSALLMFNIYLALFLTCISMIIIYVYNLYGDINPLVIVNDSWCQFRAYFVNVCFCSLYYSCVLKSLFRFFRVIFYKIKFLQSHRFFFLAIIFQWFLSFILILLNLFNGDYQYLPFQYRCWISFENIQGLLIASIIIYICPLLIIFFIYFYIVRHIRQTNQMQQKQQKTIERDLLVLKRIIIFVLVITSIGLPTVAILLIWIISGKLIPLAYPIQGLSMSIGLFIAIVCFAFITPQIQVIFYNNTKKEQCVCSPMIQTSYQETKELV